MGSGGAGEHCHHTRFPTPSPTHRNRRPPQWLPDRQQHILSARGLVIDGIENPCHAQVPRHVARYTWPLGSQCSVRRTIPITLGSAQIPNGVLLDVLGTAGPLQPCAQAAQIHTDHPLRWSPRGTSRRTSMSLDGISMRKHGEEVKNPVRQDATELQSRLVR